MPITFNIYANDGGVKGEPAGDEDPDGRDGVPTVGQRQLHRTASGTTRRTRLCYNGMIQMVTMPMPSVTLPNEVIWTVQYNTNHYGPNPTGVASPADSLNVGAKTFDDAAFVGTDLDAGSGRRRLDLPRRRHRLDR